MGDVIRTACWRGIRSISGGSKRFNRNSLLRLAAEMRLPGRAWLQFEVKPDGSGSVVRQTAIFDPAGVLGQLYWYVLYPVHQFVFAGMLRGIVRAMEQSL